LCRREGVKLMLKGTRCETAKCAMERQNRQNPPGMHAWRRGKGSGYAVRLREKQKVKRYYGLLERQFILMFRRAERSPDNTGTALLSLLERRLDNVVCKLGFAPSRRAARSMIVDGHISLNGKRLDRPGYLVCQGDRVSVKSSDRSRGMAKLWLEVRGEGQVQDWLKLDTERYEGTVLALPSRDHVLFPVEEQLIVEACSR
jgi:small subunit ribosomal protein S4